MKDKVLKFIENEIARLEKLDIEKEKSLGEEHAIYSEGLIRGQYISYVKIRSLIENGL